MVIQNIKLTSCTIGVTSFKLKFRKSKKNGRKYKRKIPLKKPYLSVDAVMVAYADCMLGAAYVDNNGVVWICTSKINLTGVESTLRIAKTATYKSFSIPVHIIPFGIQVGEGIKLKK